MSRRWGAVPAIRGACFPAPGISGYELAQRLRGDSELNGIRLVAITGYGQVEDVRRARAAGFDDHLVKPADPLALERALRC